MKIFIHANSLKAYTSGTPQRGLVKALCSLRKQDHFTIWVSRDESTTELDNYWETLSSYDNVELVFSNTSQRKLNIKKLVGLKSSKHWPSGFDLYLSPGMPEYFGRRNKPALSTIADLSSLNLPSDSSMKWHGNRIFKNTLKWCVESNNMIGAISDFTKTELIEKYPEKKQRFFTLHNGIEDFWFDDTYQENSATKKLKNKPYAIWWGLGSSRKNLSRLLTAYLELKKETPNLFEVLLVGKISPDQMHVKELIDKSDSIHLIPFQESYILKSLVKNSVGLLFPSLYEGFGLPIIEAYSQGKPVLYGNCTSMPEIASDFGIPVDPYDVPSIKEGLLQLKKHDTNSDYIEQVCKYASQFTYTNAAMKLSEIIDQLKA